MKIDQPLHVLKFMNYKKMIYQIISEPASFRFAHENSCAELVSPKPAGTSTFLIKFSHSASEIDCIQLVLTDIRKDMMRILSRDIQTDNAHSLCCDLNVAPAFTKSSLGRECFTSLVPWKPRPNHVQTKIAMAV